LGTAGGLLHAASARAMPEAFFPTGMPPSATNLGYIFVALGAVLLPLATRFLVPRWGFRSSFLVIALTALIPALCAVASGRDSFAGTQTANISELMNDIRLWLIALAVLFFSAVESTTVQWSADYLRDIGFAERGQRWLLAGFWVLFLLARLWATSLNHYLAFIWLVLVLTCLAAVALGNMNGWHNRSSGGLGFLFLAACLGPIFPTMIGLTFLYFPEQPAVAFGLVCALGALGQTITEPLVESQLARSRLRLVMGLSLILALIVALPSLVLLVMAAPP
jgi:MFS family permease